MFDQLNHTPVSNEFIDKVLPKLKGSEIAIFIVICRKTIGWAGAVERDISLCTIAKLTGLSKNVVGDAASSLKKKGCITIRKEGAGRGLRHYFAVSYNVPESGSILKNVPESGTIANPSSAKKSATSSQKVGRSEARPHVVVDVSASSTSSRRDTGTSSLTTTGDEAAVILSIITNLLGATRLPGPKHYPKLLALFRTEGEAWFRDYAKWYSINKLNQLGWSPWTFVSDSLTEQYRASITMKRKSSRGLDERGQLKGVNTEAFKARVAKIREESKHL